MNPNQKSDLQLAIEAKKLLKAGKTTRAIRDALHIGENRVQRIIALCQEPQKKAQPPKKPQEEQKPAQGKCKCEHEALAHAIALPLMEKFLLAFEFACYKMFRDGFEAGRTAEQEAKKQKK